LKKYKFLMMLLVLALVTFGATQIFASTITYTEQAVVSGQLGNNFFNNSLVTLTLVGDTANVTGSGGFFQNVVGTFTVNVASVGTATFTDPMEVFDNQGSIAAGFGDLALAGSVLDTFDGAFATYDLTTAIGPITNSPFIRPDLSFPTTLGGFNIQSAGNSTFTASTGTATPEPGSLALLGSGVLVGIGALRRKLKM
jgi:hypothetical protein